MARTYMACRICSKFNEVFLGDKMLISIRDVIDVYEMGYTRVAHIEADSIKGIANDAQDEMLKRVAKVTYLTHKNEKLASLMKDIRYHANFYVNEDSVLIVIGNYGLHILEFDEDTLVKVFNELVELTTLRIGGNYNDVLEEAASTVVE